MAAESFILMSFVVLLVSRQALGQGESLTQCQQDEPEDRKQCFTDRGLDLATMPNSLDVLHPLYKSLQSTFTMMDPNVHCDDPSAYREAARCAVNVTKACYDPDGSRNIVMNPDDVIAGMQVLCDQRQQLDMECFKNFYAIVDECSQYHRRASSFIAASQDPNVIMCATEDLKYDCMDMLMTPMCGETTTRAFLQQMDRYTVNPSCASGSPPSRPRDRYFSPLVTTTTPSPTTTQENNNGHGGGDHPSLHLHLLLLMTSVFVWMCGSAGWF